MARNVEIKARVPDLAAVREKAAALSQSSGVLIHQTDTFFAVSSGRLKVREFADGAGELIAYHRPDDNGPKASDYTLAKCGDAAALARALASVLDVRGRVKKRRELFLVGRTRVHLDEVEGLGSFVELEVVLGNGDSIDEGRQEAEDLMRRLGVTPSMLVSGAYIDLLAKGG